MPDASPELPDASKPRPLRADARRNRERVLVTAREAFAAEGLSVSLDDIARRAGVGPGTVHRHFPTKDALFEAVIADHLQSLTVAATELIDAPDAGAAFFTFFYRMADDARHNLALAAALADTGEAIREAGTSLAAALGVLLARAQHAGAVKADLQIADLHAIVAGVLVMEQRLPPASRGRGLSVVADGLRP